ncbi:MAG: hypothetical protein PHQ23_17570 [Candidatus Wallbacteria bacterium]|nr:hypothetical protein [Candidatus Wallbacteria bacterium]
MGRIRRQGFVFVTWKGDHSPYHVHVFRNRRLVLKWDLDNDLPMWGKPVSAAVRLIRQLQKEGLI